MVALSHTTARELGYTLSRRGRRPAVRRGVGPQGARRQGRRPARRLAREGRRGGGEAQPGARRRRHAGRIAEAIAIAAVRYFMVKFSRGKVIVFDIDEALSFEGESGPYLQYAVVRANNIFQKLRDREGLDEAAFLRPLGGHARPASWPARSNGTRSLGAGARGGAARRGRRAGGADARVLGPGQVRVRPGADVQRVLPPVPDPERGAGRRPAVARGGGQLLPHAADARRSI